MKENGFRYKTSSKQTAGFFALKMSETSNDEQKENKGKMDFEAEQNSTGFFRLLFKIAKRTPELWKQICNENNENNRSSNNTN